MLLKYLKKHLILADLKPGGKYVAKDMWKAGGVPMLLKRLWMVVIYMVIA